MTIFATFNACTTIRQTFQKDLKQGFANQLQLPEPMMQQDIDHLPQALQRYFHSQGYLHEPLAMNAQIIWSRSQIKMKPDATWMPLKTLQYNSVSTPFRMAYMKGHLGKVIPFEGRDLYQNGQGHMLGKLLKYLKVMEAKDLPTAQSALIIILAESLLIPGYALQDYIQWEEVDPYTVRGRISDSGVAAEGLFFFNANGEYIRFETQDRNYALPNGNYIKTPYSVSIENYRQQGNIRFGSTIRAIWHLEEGDYEYWTGDISEIRFNIQKI